MFDAALPTVGFVPRGRDVRAYGGRSTVRLKNLDRVFERDEVLYGAEIKNTLDYIDRDEFEEKLLICKDLGLRPLFICRMLPKSYARQVIQAGGFALIFKWQLYPHGQKGFAKEVHEKLGLPTDSPKVIEEGTLQRLVRGHEKIVGGVSPYNVDQEWPEEAEAEGMGDEGYLSEFESDLY